MTAIHTRARRTISVAAATVVLTTTVGVGQAFASYGLYDDTIYSSYGACDRRGAYLKAVGQIDDWVCAVNTTQHVQPPRTGIMLEICRDDDPVYACGGGSWKQV